MIERFNRTIRDKITQYFDAYKTHKYIDIINKLVENYNNSYHSSINMSPNDAEK